MTERKPAKPTITIIVQLPKELTPETDPEPGSGTCGFGHPEKPTIRSRVNYSLEFQGISYVFSGVWGNVCEECKEVYFNPSTGDKLLTEIRRETNNNIDSTQSNNLPPGQEIQE